MGGLGWVTPGMTIAVKANLVAPLRPETAAPTHPAAVTELCRLLTERGAKVVVGDSPGGGWNAAALALVYRTTGMTQVETAGATLNRDNSQQDVENPAGEKLKSFAFTSWVGKADAVIDICKLKTHGMMAMSAAVKNLFGVVPGTRKSEMHYVFPNMDDFSAMLVDLAEYVKPRLTVVDAVEAMEGNGPTQGKPRHLGAILAANNPYDADLVCAGLIGLAPEDVGTIRCAVRRGLCPDSADKLRIYGDPAAFAQPDFEKLPLRKSLSMNGAPKFIVDLAEKIMTPRPRVDREKCVGCGRCASACPRHTIHISKGKAVITRKACISCFCCQEFCPKGAITVHRSLAARVAGKIL